MAEAYRSFGELKAAHDALRQQAAAKAAPAAYREAIESFLSAAEQAGAVIEREDERRAASDLLEYWSVELVTLGRVEERTFAVPKLAPFGGSTPETTADIEEQQRRLREQLEVGRLAAIARQWRDSGRADGYLLGADALEHAERLAGADPAIAELVRASQGMEVKRTRRRQRYYGAAVSLLIVAIVITSALAFWAFDERNRANDARELAEKRSDELAAQTQAAEAARQMQADANALRMQQQFDELSRKVAQIEQLQGQLGQIAGELNVAVQQGAVPPDGLPPSLAALLVGQQGEPPAFALAAALRFANGYDPDFLGIPVAPPQLAPGVSEADARVLDYANYSVAFDTEARMPRFTMSNLDRSRLRVLPRTGIALQDDPRLPPDRQPATGLFDDGLVRGQYVSLREISWGDTPHPAGFFEAMTNVVTNIAPQSEEMNRLAWRGLEDYALGDFSRSAQRVTIFSGPVFPSEIPADGGLGIPTGFWKVLVAVSTDRKQPGPVVEAYLALQDDIDATADPGDVGVWRVRLATIEQLTGLDFGDELRTAADGQARFIQQNVRLTAGEDLALRVGELAVTDAAAADAAVEALVGALPGIGAADQAQVVDALITVATASGPETDARVVAVLARVPAESWQLPDWLDRRAAVRLLVAGWKQQPPAAEGREDLDRLAALEAAVGLPVAWPGNVYFQFAFMTRDDANALAGGLRALGWRIPGLEDLTRSEFRVNEVRHARGDAAAAAAAAELAADLRAAGRTQVQPAPNDVIKPGGPLEIWVSQ